MFGVPQLAAAQNHILGTKGYLLFILQFHVSFEFVDGIVWFFTIYHRIVKLPPSLSSQISIQLLFDLF